MKKSLLAITFVAFPLSAKTTRLRNYGCVAIVLLAGCTATQVRWDATNIRKEVMVYYNDQIIDNLIRAKYKLPFVHVDITLLTSQGGSQISGTIGAGETITNTGTQQQTNQTVTTNTRSAMPSHVLAGTIGAMGTLAHAAMRPFTYSVTPQQTETLTISAAPALGSQTVASMALPMIPTKKTEETWEPDEHSEETWEPDEQKLKKITTEKTPTPITIYDLYEQYAKCPSEGGVLSERSIRPKERTYVPGTLKRSGDRYYYIAWEHREAYYDFCKKLFTKGQAGLLGTAFQQNLAAPLAVPAR